MEIDFSAGGSEAGLNQWKAERRAAMTQLAEKMGLPLERKVEIWLIGGIRLCGILRLAEQKLSIENARDMKLHLLVDGVTFKASEIESCLRMDDGQ